MASDKIKVSLGNVACETQKEATGLESIEPVSAINIFGNISFSEFHVIKGNINLTLNIPMCHCISCVLKYLILLLCFIMN